MRNYFKEITQKAVTAFNERAVQKRLNTRLRDAAIDWDWNAVTQTLEQGADVRTDDSIALRFAAAAGEKNMVALLLEKGAQLEARKFETLKQAYTRADEGDKAMLDIVRKHALEKKIALPPRVLW